MYTMNDFPLKAGVDDTVSLKVGELTIDLVFTTVSVPVSVASVIPEPRSIGMPRYSPISLSKRHTSAPVSILAAQLMVAPPYRKTASRW